MASDREQAQTISDVFQYLQSQFRKQQLTRHLRFSFIIDGDPWTMQVGPDACEVANGQQAEAADCTVITSREIFLNIFNRNYTPSMMDLVNGKIKCDRPELMLTLKKAFSKDQ